MSNYNGSLGISSGVSRTYSIQGRIHDGLKPISHCQPWEALPGCITSWIFICISRRNDSVAHCPKSWCPANHEQCQIPVWRREVFAQRNHKNLCFNKLTQTTIISDKSMHGKTWRIDTTHTELLTMHEQSLLTSAMWAIESFGSIHSPCCLVQFVSCQNASHEYLLTSRKNKDEISLWVGRWDRPQLCEIQLQVPNFQT